MASIGVLICIGELGLGRYTVRELMLSSSAEGSTLGITIGMRLRAAAVLFVCLLSYILIFSPSGWELLLIYGIQILSNPCTELFAWFESHSLIHRLAWAQLIGFVTSAICIIVGVLLQLPLWYFAVTYAVEGWTTLAIAINLFLKSGGNILWGSFNAKKALSLFSRSWFELASQLSLFLLFRVDAIMLKELHSTSEAGLYSASVRISEVVYFIPGILCTICLPRLIELHQSNRAAYEQRMVDYFSASLVLALLAAGCLVLASPVIQGLFGDDFQSGGSILQIHAWAFIPYAIGIARTQYLTVEDKLWVNLPSTAIALIINITLNALWIPQHGGMGAAWATLIAYSVAWLGSSFVLKSGVSELSPLLMRSAWQLPSFLLRSLRNALPAR
jgi:O-antigen/teichoic acid export membrane protein